MGYKLVFRMQRSCLPELVFTPHFLEIVVEVKALGLPHVLELWLGVSKGMLPVTCDRGEGLGTATCFMTVVGGRQGHAPCEIF